MDRGPHAFWSYTCSGMTEECRVLHVGGRRLVISANYRPDSPAEEMAEFRSILNSIEIVPKP